MILLGLLPQKHSLSFMLLHGNLSLLYLYRQLTQHSVLVTGDNTGGAIPHTNKNKVDGFEEKRMLPCGLEIRTLHKVML